MAAILVSSALLLILCSATILAQNLGYAKIKFSYKQEEGSSCTTPNNERATCVRVSSCRVISDAINTRDAAAIDFARRSQCGYNGQYLVCCGTIGYVRQTRLPIYQHPMLPNSSVCGIEALHSKIVGGQNTTLQEFPWMALLKYTEDGVVGFRCGGSLISKRYVLTAAHCTKLPPNLDLRLIGVRLGEHNKDTDPDCNAEMCADPVVEVGVEEVINHPTFRKKFRVHDISLIRLDRDITFTSYIKPICLSSGIANLPVTTRLVLAGWGETEFSQSPSQLKLKVVLPVTSSSECGVRLRTTISDDQFCAGGEDNHDTCHGDSGGPAMRIVENSDPQQWMQEGIVSYGSEDCGVLGQSGVYTKVSQYASWIVSNMRQ